MLQDLSVCICSNGGKTVLFCTPLSRVSVLPQDRLWGLPLFETPARTSGGASYSPEPFHLVTAFLRQGDLLEGRDNICSHMQVTAPI